MNAIPTCFACLAAPPAREHTLPVVPVEIDLDEPEGERVDSILPTVVDAHVHLFSGPLFEAIWRWFDTHGWPIRYKLKTPQVIEHLLSRGVGQIVALHYSHKPGLARDMNAFMAGVVREHPSRVTGLATVMPGEPGAKQILEEAFALGLSGVKLHCHVQCFAPDAPELSEIYETCILHDMPIIMHAGREPTSPGYKCDPYALCHADRTAAVLRSYPKLRLAIPHLGADELEAYTQLLEQHDNLWLDTTMMLSGLSTLLGRPPDDRTPFRMLESRPDRVMYGTDFPNIPYAWDRELRWFVARQKSSGAPLSDAILESVLGDTARRFYRLPVIR